MADAIEKTEPDDLARTEELHQFLQGNVPDGFRIGDASMPKLTADQAWTVIWYLGNLYWQVTDYIERCEVCGDLYNTYSEGDCLDYGPGPYHFCGECAGAFEALIVSQLRSGEIDPGEIDLKHLPELTAKEQQALDSLGPDFIEKLLKKAAEATEGS